MRGRSSATVGLGASGLVLALIGSLACPSIGRAQASDAADEPARVAFASGRVAYREGRYEDALDDFTHAHDLSGRPELLYNIGLAADRLRRDAEAVAAFEAYLDALPTAENRAEVEGRLRALREALAVEAAATAAMAAPTAVTPASDAPHSTPVYDEWWFWTVIGVVAAVAIAIPVGVVAGSHTEPLPYVTGDIGPGGIVFALSGP